MSKGSTISPDTRIHRDNMKLTVTSRCSAFPKKSEQEVRQEISARLYQIFKKYS